MWMNTSPDYGQAIRILRNVENWNQEELADRAGIDRTYLSMIERGRRQAMEATIERISIALGYRGGYVAEFAMCLGLRSNPQTRHLESTKAYITAAMTTLAERILRS